MTRQWFTVASARRELRRLRPAAERMCELYQRLERKRPRRILSDQRVDPAYFSLVLRLQDTVRQIGGRGVRVRDVRQGLLDFPARRDGREVCLCWRVGERSLRFWHEPEAGFAGRKPVEDDGRWH